MRHSQSTTLYLIVRASEVAEAVVFHGISNNFSLLVSYPDNKTKSVKMRQQHCSIGFKARIRRLIVHVYLSIVMLYHLYLAVSVSFQ